MKLSVFKDYQEKSTTPFMCIDNDHSMPLVAVANFTSDDDFYIELKCFVNGCYYKIIPGTAQYEKILEKPINV
jgi:hypothetical protein